MITKLENEIFDTMVEPSDWRYSAAIVGLAEYFEKLNMQKGIDYEIAEDFFKFRSDCITEENFLKFAELHYESDFPHVQLEDYLNSKEIYEKDDISVVKDLLKGNTVMKKVFGKMQFDGSNKKELLETLEENRQELIRETFRNKTSMYANFSNRGQLFTNGEKKKTSRVNGYYIDAKKKSRSISFNFDDKRYVFEDTQLFDFIPFAFFGGKESFFVNNNYSIPKLIYINKTFAEKVQEDINASEKAKKNACKILFNAIKESGDYIDYDEEIVMKDRDNDFFEMLYVRKDSIDILRKFDKYNIFCFGMQLKNSYYLNVQKEILDCILNLKRTDFLIEFFLKEYKGYLAYELINLNMYIEHRENDIAFAKSKSSVIKCAKILEIKLHKNILNNYRNRLLNALLFKNYDRYCQLLIRLAGYADITFDFAFDLFEDFENNLDIAYLFVCAIKIDSKKVVESREESM